VNALMPGRPRLASFELDKKVVDARVKPAHDGVLFEELTV
jgi:hypothetical protein